MYNKFYERKEIEMKASLQLETSVDYEKEYEPENNIVLVLSLLLHGKSEYVLWKSNYLDDNDKEKYLEEVENAINEAMLFINTLNIKLEVDDSVYEFLNYDEEEIKKFVDRLLIEI